jgi:hypothetical protein
MFTLGKRVFKVFVCIIARLSNQVRPFLNRPHHMSSRHVGAGVCRACLTCITKLKIGIFLSINLPSLLAIP